MAKSNGTAHIPEDIEEKILEPRTLSVGEFLNHMHSDILTTNDNLVWIFLFTLVLVVERIIFYLVRWLG